MSSQAREIKIAVFGDSISEGIGSRRLNYCTPLETKLNKTGIQTAITNFASTGTTIRFIETKESELKGKKYDYILIAYGNVDAMLRPDTNSKFNLYAHIPSRYKKTGMLNPRPYFSRVWYKSAIQHVDSWIRWNLNKYLLKIQGAITWVGPDEFRDTYQRAINMLHDCSGHIIMLSTVHVSEKYFPGTNEMYIKYNNIIKEIAANNQYAYVDLYDRLHDRSFYYEDEFHPNETGYQCIADLIAGEILEDLNSEKL